MMMYCVIYLTQQKRYERLGRHIWVPARHSYDDTFVQVDWLINVAQFDNYYRRIKWKL